MMFSSFHLRTTPFLYSGIGVLAPIASEQVVTVATKIAIVAGPLLDHTLAEFSLSLGRFGGNYINCTGQIFMGLAGIEWISNGLDLLPHALISIVLSHHRREIHREHVVGAAFCALAGVFAGSMALVSSCRAIPHSATDVAESLYDLSLHGGRVIAALAPFV